MLEAGVRQPEKLKEARRQVNELIGHVRQISLDLRPAMLDDLGLLPALVWLIGRYTNQTGIQVDFIHSNLEDHRFSNEIEITAYRVVQESLTNSARHAQVTSVEVRVWVNQTDLMLQISDRGVGFDFDSTIRQREGQGLLGMRERVNFMGGNLFIDTRPNEGTSISAKLPIQPDREE
jgi:signal transduction histidine kinase